MAQLATWMTNPSWFLVAGLPWPQDQLDADVAEVAFAIAPDVTEAVRPAGPDGEPVPLGRDLALLLDAASRCAAPLGKRVLFVADITRWLGDIGLTWEDIGVRFDTALSEFTHGVGIGLYVELSERAHAILCSPTRTMIEFYPSGRTVESGDEDRDLLRAQLEELLDSDWPGYVTQLLADVQPSKVASR